MAKATFSSKGQIVIPKELRDEKGIIAGVVADAVLHHEGILLRISPQPKKTRHISEIFGILKEYAPKQPDTDELMSAAIDKMFQSDSQWEVNPK